MLASEFLKRCEEDLPHLLYLTITNMFAAYGKGMISEFNADQCVQHILIPFPDLCQDYNEIMQDSECRRTCNFYCLEVLDIETQ